MFQRRSFKICILVTLTILVIVLASFLKPIAQDPSYHNFADKRKLFDVPNFWNVITNAAFLIAGYYGIWQVVKSAAAPVIKCVYLTMFSGVFLTGIGSAWYHYNPVNDTLVFDRIPMTIVFMSFIASAIAERISMKAGVMLLLPLVMLGTASVLWWHYTEVHHAGDLRWYGLVQFYPVILVPLIYILFPSEYTRKQGAFLLAVIAWYAVAKLFEYYDRGVYEQVPILSGHSFKHLFSTVACYYLVGMYERTYGKRLRGELEVSTR
ncbi:MAG: hypothetical protein JWN76_2822 [Chitinophagaceae bacterium]|nr:hypothetical protein [Chitinophagaceae bacterium]